MLFLLDAQQGLVPLDLEILEKLRKQNSFVLPVNKIDGVSEATAVSEFTVLVLMILFLFRQVMGRE